MAHFEKVPDGWVRLPHRHTIPPHTPKVEDRGHLGVFGTMTGLPFYHGAGNIWPEYVPPDAAVTVPVSSLNYSMKDTP